MKRVSNYCGAIISCLTAAVVGWPVVCPAETLASYQAQDWDKEMLLPPNAYRAAAPIELHGEIFIQTQPGTLIDGVRFDGKKGKQQWKFNGTLMQRSRIGGPLGMTVEAVDSAFEDCEGNKDSAWFVKWWSTRWKFENCIFTKRMFRTAISPTDYSFNVSRCTFYGVKLPTIGFKEDPAKYLQKENMVFEKCRFVDCAVPESFLAATVDCVFEHCQFEPRGKVSWPKEMSPVRVAANYVGLDNPLASFIDGPLTVQYTSLSNANGYGSTLPHTFSGGRLVMTNFRASEKFVQMGTMPQKASEIVEAPPPGAPAIGPAPTSIANNKTETEGSPVTGVEEILRSLPSNIELMKNGAANIPGIDAANTLLLKNYQGRPVLMRMPFHDVQVTQEDGNSYQANGRQERFLYHGDAVLMQTKALFRRADAVPLGRAAQQKADFMLKGKVRKAEFGGNGHAVTFVLTVGESQVEENSPAPK